MGRRDLGIAALLAALPLLAFAPAWSQDVLLGPGDGAALHLPMRAAVWRAYRSFDLPGWDPTVFCGTPLLAAYRPGALYPPMILLAALPEFSAFQVLVLGSLSAAAAVTFLYLRRLGAGRVGAYLAGVSFALGPYLVGHLDDTATIAAAPLLPALLWAAECHLGRTGAGAAGLTVAVVSLLLVGSPEAALAGAALVSARLLVAYLDTEDRVRPSLRSTMWTLAAGVALAAPQLGPTLLAAAEAGPAAIGVATARDGLPGAMGLILRYVAHTPAAALALAAGPLLVTQPSVRVLGTALAVSLLLQWGRPLSSPGALPLVFDLTLAILGGLSLDAQWKSRLAPNGRRLRAYFLFFCLASAAALSVSAAALGPLPQVLAGAVGVFAFSLVLYFSLAQSPSSVRAGLWLLPLTVSFLLQPHGRQIWSDAPSRRELLDGTSTREAIDHVMGRRGGERLLTLVESWPLTSALDLAYSGLGSIAGRRTANGYDPMVSERARRLFDDMGIDGTLDRRFFRSDPDRLRAAGIRWVQMPSAAAVSGGEADPIDATIRPGGSRLFPMPITSGSALTLISSISESVKVAQGEEVARAYVRLTSGREIAMAIRAGVDTAEWAYDRPDVAAHVLHDRPPVAVSWAAPGGFEGHRYATSLPLPGRYNVDAVRIDVPEGRGPLLVTRLALEDPHRGRRAVLSPLGAYVSDTRYFREAAATPAVRLYELPGAWGDAWVVGGVRVFPDDDEVLVRLRNTGAHGIDLRRMALVTPEWAGRFTLPSESRPAQAEVVHRDTMRLELRAEGPGLLIVAESWDGGWSARTAAGPRTLVRVNHNQIGVVLEHGTQHVSLRYRPPGFVPGVILAMLAAVGVAVAHVRALRRGRARVTVALSSGTTQGDP